MIGLCLACMLGELMVRTFYTPVPEQITLLTMSEMYQKDEALGHLPRPNVTGRHRRVGSFDSEVRTNSLGLRDTEHALGKASGSRIVVLGDSYAWGYGVDNGEIFTDHLDRILCETEVVNLGVSAFNIRQEIDYFTRLGQRFRPDRVIVAFVQNDILLNEKPTSTSSVSATKESPAESKTKWSVRFKQFLRRNVRSYDLFVTQFNRNRYLVRWAVRLGIKDSLVGYEGLDNNVIPSLKVYPQEVEEAWEKVFGQLDELHTLVRGSGAQLILALVPAPHAVDPDFFRVSIGYTRYETSDFDLDKPYAMLVRHARAQGIDVINPLSAFRVAHESGSDLYLRADIHFSPGGHLLFATEIARHLREIGAIGMCP